MAASPLRELREIFEPYPGLRPFEPWESEIFFGRQAHTQRLIEILRERAFLAVIGPSGSGKSSLVRAGLLPELPRGRLGTGTRWRVAIMRPGNEPIRRLARALTQRDVLGPSLLRDDAIPAGPDHHTVGVSVVEAELRRGPMALVQVAQSAARRERPPGADADSGTPSVNLLVLVDQFEELFTYLDAGGQERHDDLAREAEAFVGLLLTARTVPTARVFVVMTMRTDFLGQCTRFLDLPDAINRSQYLTPRLSRGEIEMAVVGPARHFGGDVNAALANELINEVGTDPDQLPLLQHALSRMWHFAKDRTQRTDPTIETEDYDRAGGRSALSKHAEEVLAGLSGNVAVGEILTAPQQAARQLLLAVTERRSAEGGGQTVRRPQSLERIAEWTTLDLEQLSRVVRSFAAPLVNFLHYDQSEDADAEEALPPDTVIDVSHEAFVRQWQRLRDWIVEESRRAADYGRLLEKAQEYEQGQAGAGLLLGSGLGRAVEWLNDAGVGDGWRPTAAWARRYAADESKSGDRFRSVCDYVRNSDRRRREDELLEQQQLERQRMAEEAERDRRAAAALAEERQRAAETLAKKEGERAAAASQREAAAMELVAKARNQKILIGVLLVLLPVALSLAFWAYVERNNAEMLRKRAVAQALWAPIGFEDAELTVRAQDGLIAVARAPNDVAAEFIGLAIEDEAYARNFVKAPAPFLVASVGPSPQARGELLRLLAARKGAPHSQAGDAAAARPAAGRTAAALAAAIVEFALVDQSSDDEALVSRAMKALASYLSDKEIDSSESWRVPADLIVQLDTWVAARRVTVVRHAVEEQWRQSRGDEDAFPWLAALAMSCETVAPVVVVDAFEALGQPVRKRPASGGSERKLLFRSVIAAQALGRDQLPRLDRAAVAPYLISRVAACLTDAQALEQVKALTQSKQGTEGMDAVTVGALLSRPRAKQPTLTTERVQVAEQVLEAMRAGPPQGGLMSRRIVVLELGQLMKIWAQQLDSSQVDAALRMLERYLAMPASEVTTPLAIAALDALVDGLDNQSLARVDRMLSALGGQVGKEGRFESVLSPSRSLFALQRKMRQLLGKPEPGAIRSVDELLREMIDTIFPDELEVLGQQMAAQFDRVPVTGLRGLADRLLAARNKSRDSDQRLEYDRMMLLLADRLAPEDAATVRSHIFEQLKKEEPDEPHVSSYLALAQRSIASDYGAHLVAKELVELLAQPVGPYVGLANPAALRQIVGMLPKQPQEAVVREVVAKALPTVSARPKSRFSQDPFELYGDIVLSKEQSSPTDSARSLGDLVAAVSDPDARVRLRGDLLDQMVQVPSVRTSERIGAVLEQSLGVAPPKAAGPAAAAASAAAAAAPEVTTREWMTVSSRAVALLPQADRAVESRALAKLVRGAAWSVSEAPSQQRDNELIELLKYPSAAPLETIEVVRQLHKSANPPAAVDGYWASIAWLKDMRRGDASLLDAPAAGMTIGSGTRATQR